MEESARRAGRVMLVDDSRSYRQVATLLLQELGIEVGAFSGAGAAVAAYASNPAAFDAVLLDLQMPDMDGLSAYHALTEVEPDVRVVLVSGHTPDSVEPLVRSGAVAFLQKPYSSAALARVLRSFCGLSVNRE